MPIYKFKCSKCRNVLELLQNFEDSNPVCNCSKNNNMMDKLISITGRPKFSGSGFYETDYKKKSNKSLEVTNGSKDKKND